MRGRIFILLGFALACPAIALGADPAVVAPPPESAETAPPAVAPPAPIVNEKPRPAERPKPVERPRPVEKPRSTTENARSPEVVPRKPIEPPTPAVAPAPALADHGATQQSEANAGYSFGCLALSFAMLIIGIAVGFLWRHLMSRHKLGGMSVRIGTWRGIP